MAMREQQKSSVICATTSQPSVGGAATSGGGNGGSICLIDVKTGSIISSSSGSGGSGSNDNKSLGISSLSTLCFGRNSTTSSSSILAIAYSKNTTKQNDTYGMLVTLRPNTTSLSPIVHWKCRLPEPNMSAGLLTSKCGNYVIGGGSSGNLYVWKTLGGSQLVKTIRNAHYRSISIMIWSSDGTCLVTGGQDGIVHAFSLQSLVVCSSGGSGQSLNNKSGGGSTTVQPVCTWSKHTLPITSLVALSSNRIASGSQDGQVLIFELCNGGGSSGEVIAATIQFSDSSISNLCYHGGRLYVGSSSSSKGTITVIDLDLYAIHQTSQLGSVTVVQQQRQDNIAATTAAATASSSTRTFGERVFGYGTGNDDSSGDQQQQPHHNNYRTELKGHDRAITSMAVVENGDSSLLVSGDESGTIRIWDLQSRGCIRTICPWSASTATTVSEQQQKAKSRPNHPVTSITVLEASSSSMSSSAEPLFGVGGTTASNPKKNTSLIHHLIKPLQKFVAPQIDTVPVPFLHARTRPKKNNKRASTSANYWDVSANPFNIQAALLATNKRHRKRKANDSTTGGLTKTATTTTTSASLEEKRVAGDDNDFLVKELAEAKATIQRWEAVNNKLMERLQRQQEQEGGGR